MLQITFRVRRYVLTAQNFCNYSAQMDADLKSLETKITQFVEVCQRLRADNQQLRQQLASAVSQVKRLEDKVNTATARLETLLAQIPAQDDA
jgi:cell division protein ZapB